MMEEETDWKKRPTPYTASATKDSIDGFVHVEMKSCWYHDAYFPLRVIHTIISQPHRLSLGRPAEVRDPYEEMGDSG